MPSRLSERNEPPIRDALPVVDASAVLELLKGSDAGRRLLEALRAEGGLELHAPELIDAEVAQTLRRWNLSGGLAEQTTEELLDLYAQLPIRLWPHRQLLRRTWALRHGLSVYDALYVALAEGLGQPLLTADARLAGSRGHQASIRAV